MSRDLQPAPGALGATGWAVFLLAAGLMVGSVVAHAPCPAGGAGLPERSRPTTWTTHWWPVACTTSAQACCSYMRWVHVCGLTVRALVPLTTSPMLVQLSLLNGLPLRIRTC